MHMNIVVDDGLLAEALERTGLQSEREVIQVALRLLVDLKAGEEGGAAGEGASRPPALAGRSHQPAPINRH